MPRTPLEELLPIERGDTVPDDDLTTTSRIRRALFRGEVLTREEVVERFGVSAGLLAQIVTIMERMGFHFARDEDGDQSVRYTLTNPKHTPSGAQLEVVRARGRAFHSGQRKSAPVAVTQESPPPPPEPRWSSNYVPDLPPLPDLGSAVAVYALVVNDDGTVTLGLRNGTRRWMTTITGATEVTP